MFIRQGALIILWVLISNTFQENEFIYITNKQSIALNPQTVE